LFSPDAWKNKQEADYYSAVATELEPFQTGNDGNGIICRQRGGWELDVEAIRAEIGPFHLLFGDIFMGVKDSRLLNYCLYS